MRHSQFDETKNETVIEILSLALDITKSPITNADLKITWRRSTDDKYYNGSIFVTAETLLSMTEFDETNSQGWWRFLFDTTGFPPDTYIGTITDAAGNAKNMPQLTEDIVGDGIAKQIELAASNAAGRALYNESTSVLTLYAWHDPSVVIATFDMKDVQGNPSLLSAFFEKVPQ